MHSENLNIDDLTEERRKAIQQTIHTVSPEEVQALGERLFPYSDHPWRAKFFEFINENSGATFHHAVTNDHVQILYCSAKNRGIWFLPDIGVGPLQAKGLALLEKIIHGA